MFFVLFFTSTSCFSYQRSAFHSAFNSRSHGIRMQRQGQRQGLRMRIAFGMGLSSRSLAEECLRQHLHSWRAVQQQPRCLQLT